MAETLGPLELRAKCTDTMHREFSTFCTACGRENADVLRELVGAWVEREKHAHILRCRLLQGEALSVDSRGIDA